MRAIDADALILHLTICQQNGMPTSKFYAIDDVIHYVKTMPTIAPEIKTGRMSNKDWIDFLCEQFDISRTSARDMLHEMMKCKKEDNSKRIFNPMQKDGDAQ